MASPIIVGTVIGYFIVLQLVGFYYSKRMKNMDDFLVAGRRVGAILLIGTAMGTNVGGGTFMGFTAGGFTTGFGVMWTALIAYPFILIWALLFVKYVNRLRKVTVPDFLTLRYGESVRVPSAVFLALRAIVQTGLQTLAVAGVLGVVFGWELRFSMFIALFLTTSYCLMGGMSAVIVTDFVQAIFQTLGPIMLMVLVLIAAGGWSSAAQTAVSVNPEALNVWSPGAATIIALLFAMGPYYFIYQPMWQRAYAARDEKAAYTGMVWGTIGSLAICFVPVITGIAAISFAPAGIAPVMVLPWLYLEFFPPIVGAIFVATLLGAIMSVLDSMILDASANVVSDIYLGRINPKASDAQLVKVSRISVFCIALTGLLMAMLLPDLIALWVLSNTLASGAVVIPALAAWFWKPATSKGAYYAIILGGAGTLIWGFVNWITMGAPGTRYLGIDPIYVGFVVGILTMYFVSKNSKHTDDENPDKTYYWTVVNPGKKSDVNALSCVALDEVAFKVLVEA